MRERFNTAALTVRESRDGGGFPIQSVSENFLFQKIELNKIASRLRL